MLPVLALLSGALAACDDDAVPPVAARLADCGLVSRGVLQARDVTEPLAQCTQICRAEAACDELRTLVCDSRSVGALADCEARCRNPRPCADGHGQYELRRACDGRRDCADGSDEYGCATPIVCENTGRRIAESQRCNGVADCTDGSDERDCGAGVRYFACRSGSMRIPMTRVCDLTRDCTDGSDEGVDQGCAELLCR